MDGVSVSREDFGVDADSARSSPVDEALEARFREQFQDLYDTPVVGIAPVDEDIAVDDAGVRPLDAVDDEQVEDYEFRLFSGSNSKEAATSNGAVQRIAIRSPTPTSGDPGFVNPRRPDNYYFTGPLDSERAEQIAAAAISGEEIFQGLKLKWRGCELPCRVTVIPPSQLSKSISTSNHSSQPISSSPRKRSGKKRRIAIRMKTRAIKERKMNAKLDQAQKEVADREKRTRRNREKKVKKKLKDKAQKLKGDQDVQGAG